MATDPIRETTSWRLPTFGGGHRCKSMAQVQAAFRRAPPMVHFLLAVSVSGFGVALYVLWWMLNYDR